jgi:hypothetical protein
MRERVERGLDPGEADRPGGGRVLSLEPPGSWPEAHPGWEISYAEVWPAVPR